MRRCKKILAGGLFGLLALTLAKVVSAQTYTYDLDGRLTGVAYTNNNSVTYAYDANGNISAIVNNSIAQTTNTTVLIITSPTSGNNGSNNVPYMFSLTWNTIVGTQYQIQFSTNLAMPNWQTLGNPITATNSLMTANFSTTNSQGFYRVIYQP